MGVAGTDAQRAPRPASKTGTNGCCQIIKANVIDGRRVIRFPGSQQIVARHTTTLDHPPKLVERLDLDLAHALAGQAEFGGNFFERADVRTAQAIASFSTRRCFSGS